jgi:hypothetical protein
MDFKYPCGCSFDIFVYYEHDGYFQIERIEDDGASFELCDSHKELIQKQHDEFNKRWNEEIR